MSLLQRLQEIHTYSGLSLRAFANKCDISQPTLDKQIKGLRSVSIETIMSVLYAFPEISADWLMRGEGEMLNTPATDPNTDRINSLIDTIATLQEAINTKSETITALSDRIKQLEALIKK